MRGRDLRDDETHVVAHADEVLAVPVRVLTDHGQSVKVAEPVALDGAAAGRHELHLVGDAADADDAADDVELLGLGQLRVLRDGVGLQSRT